MKYSNKGFSFIEVLISVAILIVLAAVGITYSDNMTDKSNNSKVKTELSTLQNSFTLYQSDVKAPILPSGNQKFFSSGSTYAHDQVGAFGVSGFATETTIPKKYINYLPVDPKTNQYYAYATTLETGEFEVAGLIKHNKTYQALVNGTYTGNETIPNLIREYNGPNFVFNKSLDALPYNPYERILTAKIHNFTGTVVVNDTPRSLEELKDLDLFEGDTIKVGTGEFAEIFFSDGSQSTLGDSDIASELTLANMRFPEEYNLTTQIKLALSVGSLWTKASKMSEKSQFEIYTIDSVAAVRGTVFGVRRANNETNTVVLEGKVEVNRIIFPPVTGGNGNNSFQSLTDSIVSPNPNFSTGSYGTPYFSVLGTGSTIVVNKGDTAKGITTSFANAISTGATLKLPTSDTKEKIIENAGNINSNIQLKVLKLDTVYQSVELELTPTLKTATRLELNTQETPAQNSFSGGLIIVRPLTLGENTIKLCDAINCTAELKLNLNNQTSFTKPIIDNMIDDVELPEPPETCDGIEAQGTCGENLMGTGWQVTHFAPFDVAGDLNMYRKNQSIITMSQSGVLSNGCYFKFYDNSFSKFYDSLCSDLPTYVTRMTSFTNIFVKENSWLDIKDGFKGIVLDNHNPDNDFLKYDFTSEGISGDYVLEFQVRGADLLRSGTKYQLFSSPKFSVNQENQILKTQKFISPLAWQNSGISSYLTGIDSSKNYVIQVHHQTGGNNKVVIKDTPISITTTTDVDFLNDWLYINNSNDASPVHQWNGVLDYVKIYKKSE